MRRFLCLLLVGLASLCASGQLSEITLSKDKTTSLVFPLPINHVDLGSSNIIAQQVKDAENILLVKAAAENFAATNITIVVADNGVYSFPVKYEATPSVWVYHVLPSSPIIETFAKSIIDNQKRVIRVRAKKEGMVATLNGIYVRGDIMYCHLNLQNTSSIDYDLDLLRCYIGDRIKAKRTAIQEVEVIPLQLIGSIKRIRSMDKNSVVIALPKLTVADKQFLAIDLTEKSGERNLLLKISNRKILNATALPK